MSRPPPSSSFQFTMPSHNEARSAPIRLHPQPRYHGDGLDMRRPVVSIPEDSPPPPPQSRSHVSNFVDLTGADDVDSEASTATIHETRRPRTRADLASLPHTRPASRLPRYSNNIIDVEVIDLEDEPRQDQGSGNNTGTTNRSNTPSSPEIEFIRARQRRVPFPPVTARPVRDQAQGMFAEN